VQHKLLDNTTKEKKHQFLVDFTELVILVKVVLQNEETSVLIRQ